MYTNKTVRGDRDREIKSIEHLSLRLYLPHFVKFLAHFLKVRTELESMNIRSRNPSDYQAIAELNRQVFERDNEAQLVESIRHSDRYIPELELVAELNHAIVGHILRSVMGVQQVN